MRSGAATGHRGLFHETATYGSDVELLDLVVPFVEEGVAAGEPVLLALDEPKADLCRGALGPLPGVTYVGGAERDARPATTLRTHLDAFSTLLGRGAAQVRVAGEVPHPGSGSPWGPWARYEAAVNRAFADLPVWGLCPYDTRTAPPEVLDDALCTHPFVASVAGHHRENDRYLAPEAFVGRLPGPALPATPPQVVLVDPSVGDARRAAGDGAVAAGLSFEGRDAVRLATSEVVTNALRHGEGPVRVEVWHAAGRTEVVVSDAGPGPDDPLLGLLRPRRSPDQGGFGLWITHQLCDEVEAGVVDGRYVVRMAFVTRG